MLHFVLRYFRPLYGFILPHKEPIALHLSLSFSLMIVYIFLLILLFAFIVDPQELLEEILDAEDSCNDERLEGLFCGAIKYLHGNRSKPDPAVYLTLMYLSKTSSSIFNSDVIIQVGIFFIYPFESHQLAFYKHIHLYLYYLAF